MGSDEKEPEPYWARYRSQVVCPACWVKRHPDRVPARLLGADETECVICEQPCNAGIYVRMRVEWR